MCIATRDCHQFMNWILSPVCIGILILLSFCYLVILLCSPPPTILTLKWLLTYVAISGRNTIIWNLSLLKEEMTNWIFIYPFSCSSILAKTIIWYISFIFTYTLFIDRWTFNRYRLYELKKIEPEILYLIPIQSIGNMFLSCTLLICCLIALHTWVTDPRRRAE